MKFASRAFTLLMIILGAGVLLAACGDEENGNGLETPTPSVAAGETSPTATPTETATPETTEVPAEPTAEPSPTATPAGNDSDDDEVTTVLVYLVRGEEIGVASRDIAATPEVATGAMNELLTGTTGYEEDIGLHSEVPTETRLLGINISDGIATVDLSEDFEAGGGSFSMTMRVAQVVHTLTQFDTVDAVEFRIEGQDVEAIGGEGVLVDRPVTREDFEEMAPAILVESPTPGEIVTSPIELSGTANTFEATYHYEVIDNSGEVIAEDFDTATSGTGQRGTFEVSIPVEVTREGIGSLIVYEESARDGSRINEVEIPIDLRQS